MFYTKDFKELYESKRRDVAGALDAIQSHDVIFVAQAAAEPQVLLEQLHTLADRGIKDVQVQTCVPLKDYRFITDPTIKDSVMNHCWFFTPAMRKAQQAGNATFTPQHAHIAVTKKFSGMQGRRPVLFCTCSPMDNHGYLSLSLSNIYERDVIDGGAVILCEVNPNYPRTFGDNVVHISEVTALVESDRPITEIQLAPYTETDAAIGRQIAELVPDGATIQLGIGNIPNAVAMELRHKKHLGIHTEMFTETMCDLIECGAVDNSAKGYFDGFSVCSFAYGTNKLYRYLDNNPTVQFKRGSWVNDPFQIQYNKNFTSINATLEVDLTGQCCSETIGPRQYTGTGGQADTVWGSQRSPGGKSILAMHSTYMAKDAEGKAVMKSKIVPFLAPGSAVSLSRNDVDYVVTEYGVAWLRGLSVCDRVEALIGIAHPNLRDELRFAAKKYDIR